VQGVSFNKPKAKSSVNQQVKAGLAAVRDFLAGHTVEPTAAQPTDKEARQEVAAELLAAMKEAEGAAKTAEGHEPGQTRATDAQGMDNQKSGAGESKQAEGAQRTTEEQERARQLFVEHGYFDESVETLRSSTSSAERADAARALGLVGSQRGTAHLIAAMFDEDAEVRGAAEEALAQIGEPTFKNAGAATPQTTEKPPMIEASVLPRRTPEQTSAPGIATAESSVKEADKPVVVASAKPAAEAPHREATTSETQTRSHTKAKAATTHKSKATESQPHAVSIDPNAPAEEQELFTEETRVRERAAKLQQRIQDRVTARKESENEAQWRLERESKLLTDAAAQRAKDEELRKKAEEEAALRRKQEIEAIAAEQNARLQAESKSQKLADDEIGLRAELIKLTNAAEDFSRRRVEKENARVAAAAAARDAEAQQARDVAEKRHNP
jgi:hypothetical protein